MTLQQIYYALEVASVGSMNKAAEKLYISQPTLTSAIRDIEAELGIVMFSRNSRGVSLTVEGADFSRKQDSFTNSTNCYLMGIARKQRQSRNLQYLHNIIPLQ